MAPLRLSRPVLAVLAALALSGCGLDGVVSASATALFGPAPAPDRMLPQLTEGIPTVLAGRVSLPSAIGSGGRIVEDGAAAGYRALQTAFELPVQHGSLFLRTLRYEPITHISGQYTDAEGRFAFPRVPARNVMFLSGHVKVKGSVHRYLAFARVGEAGQTTEVAVDVASTLVARQLLRIWQMSHYQLEMQNVAPQDLQPLLNVLRDQLRGGLPDGITLDLTRLTAPDEAWSLEKDRADSVLVAMDRLAARSVTTQRELDRLYRAVKYERPASL